MAKAKKLKYGNDRMEVSSFVAEGVRVFNNATVLEGDTLYSWEIVNHCTDEVVFKQPFTANPVFAYDVEKFKNMDVVARVRGDAELSCKVFEAQVKELPEIKMMYVRRANFFRFTNITNVEGVCFNWQVQAKVKRRWEDVCITGNQDANIFEYTFEKGRDYRVTAFISDRDGGCSARIIAEISANELEIPVVI